MEQPKQHKEKSKKTKRAPSADEELARAHQMASDLAKRGRDDVAAGSAEDNKRTKRAPPPPAEDAVAWTCELCDTVIMVRPDGRAKAQHLAGKAHLKKARQAAGGGAAPSEVREMQMFECRLCGCTGPASAQAVHDAGKRHRERLYKLGALAPKLKKGDWICCSSKHPYMEHCFAKAGRCTKSGCTAVRETQMSYEEAQALALTAQHMPAPAPKPAGSSEKKVCKDCGETFEFSARQQATCLEKGWKAPVRCGPCRQERKATA
jgi:hypothetical protein